METYFVWTVCAWNNDTSPLTAGLVARPMHERQDFIQISLVAKNEPDAKDRTTERLHRDHYQVVGATEYITNTAVKSMDRVADAMEKCAGSEEQA